MAGDVRVVFLGGLGEIGRNCAVLEQDGQIVILDCGVMFPDPEMPGVDLVLPDFSYLRERKDARRRDRASPTGTRTTSAGLGLFAARPEQSALVYGSALSIAWRSSRGAHRRGQGRASAPTSSVAVAVRRRTPPDRRRFDVEFIPVTHSVPHGFATAFHTAQGVIVHSGDFKLDHTPVDGRRTDLARIGALSDGEGIRLLLSDSTNAEEPGYTKSERSVGESLRRSSLAPTHGEQAHRRRLLREPHSSHPAARRRRGGHTVVAVAALLGRSMLRNVGTGPLELGLSCTVPDEAIVEYLDSRQSRTLAPGQVCVILSTGSQGEPMSWRLRSWPRERTGRFVHRRTGGDVVVLSSHAIPGNEWAVAKVMDGLARRGAEVIHSGASLTSTRAGTRNKANSQTLLVAAWRDRSTSFPCTVSTVVFAGYSPCAPRASRWASRQDNVLLCEDGDSGQVSPTPRDSTSTARRPRLATCSSTASSATSAHGVLRRTGRVLAEEGVVVVVVAVSWTPDRAATIITGARDHQGLGLGATLRSPKS